ncbi:MAG: C_GCAxxG_C_C family protein [Lachnospiraceae bacterium]|nr:C_GCAxxG_C_C family protein [Lachnospiraceae bacterium]
MTKKELAIALHDRKFNCCQAVACAYAQEIGVDVATLFKAGEGFGLGMGCMDGTCGALSGAIMLAGFYNSDGNIDAPATKADTYKISKEMLNLFKEKCHSTICRELKGIDTGEVLCSCPDCIMNAVEVVEEVLKF